MLTITIGNQSVQAPEGTTVQATLRMADSSLSGVLAAQCGGILLPLDQCLSEDCKIEPVTVADREGWRVYERSLRFVFLMAVDSLYPGQQVRVEYSTLNGVYIRLPGHLLSADEVRAIEQKMREFIAADLPITKRVVMVGEAIECFEKSGQTDKVRLLKLRQKPTCHLYTCGSVTEYLYGVMAPSTGYASVFSLIPQNGNVVMQLPSSREPDKVEPYMERPKYLNVFATSAEWCRILGVVNAADLTDVMREGRLRDFIRVNEALHDKAIGAIADEILHGGKKAVFVAGPSSSGKTTFAARLAIHLKVLGLHPVQISLDDYYLNYADQPVQPDGSVDLETIHALDLPLIQKQLKALLAGEQVEIPHYDFKQGGRSPKGRLLQLQENDPLIIEGIHGLNPLLTDFLPTEKIHRVFVSALTCLNLDDHNRIRTTDVRLLRRIVRDWRTRGTSPEQTVAMWDSVRAGEEKWIFPYQEMADSVFNTALHYELMFLKPKVYDLLAQIPKTAANFLTISHLKKTLDYIPSAPECNEDEIPGISLLREFIGQSTFEED